MTCFSTHQARLRSYCAGDAPIVQDTLNLTGEYDPIVGDFDGDGCDDILLYGRGTLPDYLRLGALSRTFEIGPAPKVDGHYDVTVGDFNADGRDDIFWSGDKDYIWYADPAHRGKFISQRKEHPGDARPFSGDFDGDGAFDIVWYDPG